MAKKIPRNEVISLRLSEERLQLLERSRRAFSSDLGRDVSLSEAVFLALEDRAAGMDRTAARAEFLKTPTTSLARIRQRWESEHTLSAAEWDVMSEYVLAGAEEERQEPPALSPAIPSRESYLALLDAFEAVYEKRQAHASPRVWSYFGNLDGYRTPVHLSDTDADQRHQALLDQIATQQQALRTNDVWHAPGHVGRCLSLAILEEGVVSTDLDHILAKHWPTLWGLAARGHWIRHRRPIRAAGTDMPSRLDPIDGPRLTVGEFSLSFTPLGGPEFATTLRFGAARGFTIKISEYPELAELHAMLDGSPRSWTGKYFRAFSFIDVQPLTLTLWLKRLEVSVDLSGHDWQALRTLVLQAWGHAELQPLLQELRQQYGEQGAGEPGVGE